MPLRPLCTSVDLRKGTEYTRAERLPIERHSAEFLWEPGYERIQAKNVLPRVDAPRKVNCPKLLSTFWHKMSVPPSVWTYLVR